MSAQLIAEELLLLMAYGVDLLMFPTFRNWDQSYEGWLYRNGLLGRLHYLEKQKWLEREGKRSKWVYRLTDKGRAFLHRGRSPEQRWRRKWDGTWRQFIFDLPVSQQKARVVFLRWLRQHGFGYLQDSVWITPDPIIPEWKRFLRESELTDWVLLFESAERGPVDYLDIARKVWALDELAKRYRQYLAEFRDLPGLLRAARSSALLGDVGRAARRESQSYFNLLQDDPMLPRKLVAADFPGAKADELHAMVRDAVRTCFFQDRP